MSVLEVYFLIKTMIKLLSYSIKVHLSAFEVCVYVSLSFC